MIRHRHMRVWSRQATALVAALSLVLHVGLMALAPQTPLPASIGRDASVHHAHHSGDADGPRQEGHGKTADHAKPCCILSHVSGMPTPPSGNIHTPPRPVASILDFEVRESSDTVRLVTPYPVGARAPPALA